MVAEAVEKLYGCTNFATWTQDDFEELDRELAQAQAREHSQREERLLDVSKVKWHFFQAPKWLEQRREVSHGAKRLYAAIYSHSRLSGRAFPRQSVLSTALGVEERTIRKWLTELEGWGLIIRRTPTKGNWTFTFLRHRWQDEPIYATSPH